MYSVDTKTSYYSCMLIDTYVWYKYIMLHTIKQSNQILKAHGIAKKKKK